MRRVSLASGILLVAWLTSLAGAQPAANEHESPIQFRRIYFPKDQSSNLRSAGRYLPKDPQEFERIVASIRNHDSAAGSAAQGALVRTEYSARLTSSEVLQGDAQFEFQPLTAGSQLVLLDPFAVALHDAHWMQAKDESAVIGTGADGRLLVKADRPGTLQLSWSLRGVPDETGVMVFQFELPPCPVASLKLELPPGVVPQATGAIVQPEAEADPRLRRWRISFPPAARFELKLTPQEAESTQRGAAIVRQKLRYDISPRGLQVAADFQLEIDREPLRQIELQLDARLRLLRIVDEEQRNLPWTTVSSSEGDPQVRALLDLAQPLAGPHHTISVMAAMPVQTGVLWRLPALSLRGLDWQQGDALLRVRAPLVIEDLVTRDCRQSLTGLLPAPNVGEMIELQYFTAESGADIRLENRQGRMRMSSGTEIVLERSEVRGTTIAQFNIGEGEAFEISADVSPGWNIESLDSIPPQEVADWMVSPQGESSQRLSIRLARPLSPQRPVWITFSGSRPRAAIDERVVAQELAMWNVHRLGPSRRFMSLEAAAPYQLRLHGDENLKTLPSDQVMDGEQALLFGTTAETLFELAPANLKMEVSLRDARPQFSAEIAVEAACVQGLLAETYDVRCVPVANSLDRIRVRFSPSKSAPPRWFLNTDNDHTTLTARKISSASDDSGGDNTELWEITLPRPQSEPFKLRAARVLPLEEGQPISLASLPEATSQEATLLVRAAPDMPLWIRNTRLKPIPAQQRPGSADLRMAYRYDPERDADNMTEPAISISTRDQGVAQPAALVWRCALDVFVEPGGHSRHIATYAVQNFGSAQLTLSFPSSVRLDKVAVDGIEVAATPDLGRLSVPIPADRSFADLEIRWSRPTMALFASQSYEAEVPLPTAAPVLSHERTVYLPPSYSILAADQNDSTGDSTPTIAQRLWGPLAGASGRGPWNPLTADWQDLLEFQSPRDRTLVAGAETNRDRWSIDAPWDRPQRASALVEEWRAYPIDEAEPVIRVTIIRDGLARALGWAVFLLAAAWSWWQSSTRLVRVVWAAGIVAAAALFVPLAAVPLTSGALLGLFCGTFAWFALVVMPTAAPFSVARRRRNLVLSRIFQLLTVAGLLACAASATAQNSLPDSQVARPAPASAPPSTPSLQPVFQVFVPVDVHDRPTGGRYYVPEQLWQRLMQLSSRVTGMPAGFVIERAAYRQSLTWDPLVRRLQAGPISTSYFFRAPGRSRVQLPLGRLAGAMALDSLKLDGVPMQFEWEEEGQVLAFDAGDMDIHQLDFVLRPTTRQIGSAAGFDAPLLPVAASHYELSLPAGAPLVDITSALGDVASEADNTRIVAELGAADRLAVRWRDTADPATSTPVLDVHELLWLKVQSNSVVLSARLLLNVTSGSATSLSFLADPHLRRLPLLRDDPLIADVRTDPVDPRRRELVFSRPVTGQDAVELNFLLTDASGIGVLRVPKFDVQQVRHRRRWLALSVAPALQSQTEVGETVSRIMPADFVAKWGATEERPTAVFQLQGDEDTWRLATRPVETRRSVAQLTKVSTGIDAATIHFEADVESTGRVFQHRLQAPPELEIDSLSVSEQTSERLARWSRDADGNIVLFLVGAAQGAQHIELHGHLPVVGDTSPLPRVTLQSDTIRTDEIQVFRQPSASIELQDLAGFEQVTEPPAPDDPDLGRLVQRLKVAGAGPSARLKISPNRPECQAVQVTSLHYLPEQDAWEVQVDVVLTVKSGLVDAVRFSIPPSWTGPHTLLTPLAAALVADLGPSPRLTVRPSQPISDHARLVLRGRLSPPHGAPLVAPAISILDDFQVEHYLDLPKQGGLDRLVWETQGLQPADLPAGFQRSGPTAPTDDAAYETFHALRSDFRAVKTSAPASSEFPEVMLADYRVAYRPSGWLGSAVFDCMPGEHLTCRLQIPQGCQIAECRVAGRSAVAVAESPQVWRLELGFKRLPQRIELMFLCPPSGGDQAATGSLEVPRLLDLPVRRTLWTVAGTSQVNPRIAPEMLRSRWDHERIRLQSAVSTVADAAAIAAEEPAAQVQAWYAHWAAPLAASRDSLDRLLATGRLGTQRRRIIDSLSATLEQHAAVEQRLGVTPSPQGDAAAEADRASGELWDWATSSVPGLTTFIVQGESNRLNFDRHDHAAAETLIRVLIAATLLLAAGVLAHGIRHGWVRNWFWRWPRTCGVVFGLAWWLWLSPSFLGWVWIALAPIVFRPAAWKSKRDASRRAYHEQLSAV